MKFTINRKVIVSAVIGVIFLAAALVLGLTGCGSPGPGAGARADLPTATSTVITSVVPSATPSPPSAQQVASQLSCGRFHDDGPGGKLDGVQIVTDSAICWIGSVKYGIDTFRSEELRNMWIKLDQGLGMNPVLKESAFMVFYKANDQSSDVQ